MYEGAYPGIEQAMMEKKCRVPLPAMVSGDRQAVVRHELGLGPWYLNAKKAHSQ
jgi:hypothetical protein